MDSGKRRIARGAVLALLIALTVLTFFLVSNGKAGWLWSFLVSTDHSCIPPTVFGTYHLAHIGLCFVLSVLSGFFAVRLNRDRTDTVVYLAGVLLFVMEVYKQLYYYFLLGDRTYNFSVLPFQFCSLGLYLFLITPMLSEGRLKDALYKFLALFGTMGGCLVIVYPAFYDRVSLNAHTMLWHIILVSVGILILFSRGYGKHYLKELVPGVCVFLPAFTVATILNEVLTPLIGDYHGTLNLFYMSRYQPCNYLLIRDVRERFGWPLSLVAYALLFIFVGATTVFLVAFLIRRIGSRLRRNKS